MIFILLDRSYKCIIGIEILVCDEYIVMYMIVVVCILVLKIRDVCCGVWIRLDINWKFIELKFIKFYMEILICIILYMI